MPATGTDADIGAAHPRRLRVARLSLACVLSALSGAMVVFLFAGPEAGERPAQDAVRTVRALSQSVDAELLNAELLGHALATSSFLARQDLAGFHRSARELVAVGKNGSNVVLSDRTGRQLLDTLRPFGETLPPHGDPEQLRRVLDSGRPVVSYRPKSALSGANRITVDVPVPVNGATAYALSIGLAADQLHDVLHRQRLQASWMAAIVDSKGIVAAGTAGHEGKIGANAVRELLKRIRGPAQGTFDALDPDGVPTVVAYSRSPNSQWSVAIAVPRPSAGARLLHNLTFSDVAITVLLAFIAWIAWFAGWRTAGPARSREEDAAAPGTGNAVPAYPGLALGAARADNATPVMPGQGHATPHLQGHSPGASAEARALTPPDLRSGEMVPVRHAAIEGSAFWTAPTAGQPAGTWHSLPEMAGLDVLMACNSPFALEALLNVVVRLGWTPTGFSSGEGILQHVSQPGSTWSPRHVILLDSKMTAGMDGIATARALRSATGGTGGPVIILMTSVELVPHTPPDCSPADIVLTKPVTTASLHDAVAAALQARNRPPAAKG